MHPSQAPTVPPLPHRRYGPPSAYEEADTEEDRPRHTIRRDPPSLFGRLFRVLGFAR